MLRWSASSAVVLLFWYYPSRCLVQQLTLHNRDGSRRPGSGERPDWRYASASERSGGRGASLGGSVDAAGSDEPNQLEWLHWVAARVAAEGPGALAAAGCPPELWEAFQAHLVRLIVQTLAEGMSEGMDLRLYAAARRMQMQKLSGTAPAQQGACMCWCAAMPRAAMQKLHPEQAMGGALGDSLLCCS